MGVRNSGRGGPPTMRYPYHPLLEGRLYALWVLASNVAARSLSDLKNQSENLAGRGQNLPVSPDNSRSIAQEGGEI